MNRVHRHKEVILKKITNRNVKLKEIKMKKKIVIDNKVFMVKICLRNLSLEISLMRKKVHFKLKYMWLKILGIRVGIIRVRFHRQIWEINKHVKKFRINKTCRNRIRPKF